MSQRIRSTLTVPKVGLRRPGTTPVTISRYPMNEDSSISIPLVAEPEPPIPATVARTEISVPAPVVTEAEINAIVQAVSNSSNPDDTIIPAEPNSYEHTFTSKPVVPDTTKTEQVSKLRAEIFDKPTEPTTKPIPDYNSMAAVEQAAHRGTFRTKYGILREAWPSYHIEDFDDNMPLEQVHTRYNAYIHHIYVCNEADRYKNYLVVGWTLAEIVCAKLGHPITGFTKAQLLSLNRYKMLLIELGEESIKSGNNIESRGDWSTMTKLIALSLINAVAFYLIQLLARFIGEEYATLAIDALSSSIMPQSLVTVNTATEAVRNATPTIPLPTSTNGLDIGSIISNVFQSLVLRQTSQPTTAIPVARPVSTPAKFVPQYNE